MLKRFIPLLILTLLFSCITIVVQEPQAADSAHTSNSSTETTSVSNTPTETDNGYPYGYNPDHRYDPNFVVDTSLTELGGYKVVVEKSGNPFAMFYDKEKTHWNIATYNYERQFWFWRFDHFDVDAVDLSRLYKQIDLSKTELNRDKPDILSFKGYLNRENKNYDYSNDPEFAKFIEYLDRNNYDPSFKDYYLKAANNPAKRGALLPQVPGRFYEESEYGIQHLGLVNNNRYFTDLDRGSYQAGGMELMLQMADFKMVTSFKGAANVIRKYIHEDKPIPLVIAEIYPLDRNYDAALQGQSLYTEIEKAHEEMFGHDFSIKTMQVTLDYNDFIGQAGVPYEGTSFKMDRLFDEHIHSKYGEDAVYMYIFTDSIEFKDIDSSPSHPRIWGAYVTNWDRHRKTYFHELGHVLSLRHHFPSREYSNMPESHCSAPCIMNYSGVMKSDEFCPLCMYSLGLDIKQ